MLGLTTSDRPTYAEPTFAEMIGLAVDFGIVSEAQQGPSTISMKVLNDPMELSNSEAAVLLKGLLLGYFYSQARDDLSLARWSD